jgi:hypothetical protein
MSTRYHTPRAENTPFGSGDPYYNESTGYITPHPAKKRNISNWIKIGVPVLAVVVVGAVLGGVLGSRSKGSVKSAGSGGAASGSNSGGSSGNNGNGRFATATNPLYLVPLYPSTVRYSA